MTGYSRNAPRHGPFWRRRLDRPGKYYLTVFEIQALAFYGAPAVEKSGSHSPASFISEYLFNRMLSPETDESPPYFRSGRETLSTSERFDTPSSSGGGVNGCHIIEPFEATLSASEHTTPKASAHLACIAIQKPLNNMAPLLVNAGQGK